MLSLVYPPGTSLKPLFFVLQSFCLMGFLFQMTSRNKHSAKPGFWGLLYLHLAVLATTVILFFVYVAIDLGKYGIIRYTDSIWIVCYVVGLSVTCFWFFSKLLREPRFRTFSIVFLFIGLAFFIHFLNIIYLWPQWLFGYPLPSDFERVTRYSPPIFMGLALFYTWIRLSIRRNVAVSLASFFKFFVVIMTLLLPYIWNSYRRGLINLIINATINAGLEYYGYSWYSVSLYLAAFVTYIFLVKRLSKSLDQTIASYLILLGVLSFPWNGLTLLDRGYSSIPGNILSIDAIIVGFFLRKRHQLERKV
jgi:hypothetical protein